MQNILFSIIWIIILILFIWYISGLIAWIYILILPFVACFPAIKPVTDILLKVVQFPLVAGKNIRDGTMDVSLDSGASSD